MKKLLAIAVAAAFAAPMVATADVSVGGTIDLKAGLGKLDNEQIVDDAGDTEIRIKASTGLDYGLTGTAAVTHEFDASGAGGSSGATTGKLGLKGGFGHVTIGSVSKPMDQADSNIGWMTGHGKFADGSSSQGINYTGKFGGAGVYVMGRPNVETGKGTKNQIGASYAMSGFSLGVAAATNKDAGADANSKTRATASYGGANYNIGAIFDKAEGGAKSTSVGAKYKFGKAYVTGTVGKKEGAAHNAVKVGYGLGKGFGVYFASGKGVSGADGIGDDATENDDRSNGIGMTYDF